MNTKTLSDRSISVIDQYMHFTIGTAVCSVPYFNNKTKRTRAALRVFGGKGSPKDISEEVMALAIKSHVPLSAFTDASLKKLLSDNNVGIDCSGFAYYVLNAESQKLGKGSLDKHIAFVNCKGLISKIRCSFRPVENCDVATLADDKNSAAIELKDIQPGDMIIMTSGPEGDERDHLLILHQIEYQNFIPTEAHYSHAVAYPEDGKYGTGIRQGMIKIESIGKPLAEARWIENNLAGNLNRIYARALKSKTEIRRLNWF